MSLIKELLLKGKEVIDIARRPLIIKRIGRVFESALDSSEEVRVKETYAIQGLQLELVEKPEEATAILNKIVACEEKIAKADRTTKIVEKQKLAMLGTEEEQKKELEEVK